MATPRKTTTRSQRLARRLKRTRTRWKRRARTARNAYRKAKKAPSKLRAAARGMGGATGSRRQRPPRKRPEPHPDRPSRVEAMKTAGPWIAVGGVMIAAPLSFGVGGGWLGVAGGAVAAERLAIIRERPVYNVIHNRVKPR